ncbi:MAG: leucine--tRNA ligase [Chromatiales bacterium]|nr:leucine--tRNA ligase [Chromatiales bacterium]
MEPIYDPARIEADAQRHWDEQGRFRASEDPDREKFYCLSMFPYPSGRLHMGHVRNYTIGDVITRRQRMLGKNVLQPMGWDAFGLPAENAAIANGVPPAKWTWDNIDYMRGQLRALGFGIDWSRELATCQPDYYHWNQWLFLRMLESGIAYQKTGVVNWDPVDQTVLANEQVIDGRGWRTGAPVEKREIPMYYLAITRYADELLDGLEQLPEWPERVRAMQANWIGRSEGVRFAFPYELDGEPGQLWVFTTRADTIMGVTFCAVAAEHPLAERAARDNPQLAAFIAECRHGSVMEADLATIEKKGMPTGISVTHPLTGAEVPVWVGNYVLMGYGEGAVMAVPAHDERDFHFAQRYGLPIQQVIAVDGETFSTEAWQDWYADKTRGRCVNSGAYDGLDYAAAVDAIAASLAGHGLGDRQRQYRLRDWGISRQRYWGCPIPLVHCETCGVVPVPGSELPVVLPEDCVPDGSGNPLRTREDFINTECPKCGAPARRETDTMDTFVDSSWYYARYCSPKADAAPVDAGARYWMPVDQYIGGIEHAILHLLYSRFWSRVMRDTGLVEYDEPFVRLLTQGMVLNHIFKRRTEKGGVVYFAPDEVELTRDAAGNVTAATSKADGRPVDYDGIGTMSKSKRNGIDPQSLVERYGADTVRLYMMFTAPPEQTLEWSDAGVEGAHRFLKRLWALAAERRTAFYGRPAAANGANADARFEIHSALKKANFDYERNQFNTVVSTCMTIVNTLYKLGDQPADEATLVEGMGVVLRLLAPIAPHVAHELWRELGYGDEVLDAGWPEVDPRALVRDTKRIVLMVNGKKRGETEAPSDADQSELEAIARAHPDVRRFTAGRSIRKAVVVPGKLVNLVVSD